MPGQHETGPPLERERVSEDFEKEQTGTTGSLFHPQLIYIDDRL